MSAEDAKNEFADAVKEDPVTFAKGPGCNESEHGEARRFIGVLREHWSHLLTGV
jgi:hypothetical protein